MTQTHIAVRGAREHNLKNISLDIPREKLVIITGLSGSGKSSLAFDTIYAEGQRRYVESLSAYARQFLEMMQKPDVDLIDGLSPAISIEQKTTSRNPRSTVGTVTEIYDYMRLLWARVGVPYSPATGLPIESQIVSQMVDRVLALPEGARLYLLAPMIRGRKGEYRKEFADLQKRGFQRVKVDGKFYEIADAPALDKKIKHDIDVVVDRIVVRADIAARLADSFETALELADGIAIVEFADAPKAANAPPSRRADGAPQDEASPSCREGEGKPARPAKPKRDPEPERITFSQRFACPVSGFTIDEIEPQAILVQQPVRRVPEMRWPRHRAEIRVCACRARPVAEPAQGRDRALGAHRQHLALLHADAGSHREPLQRPDGDAVEQAAEEGAGRDPVRLGRRAHRVHL